MPFSPQKDRQHRLPIPYRKERRFQDRFFAMPVDITNPGTEVIVQSEGNQGVDV